MKMKFSILTLVVLLLVVSLASCTDNSRAKSWGGEAHIILPPGQKLVNATWKDDELWYLTRLMKEDETPENYTFQEKSSWGMLEGTVTISETVKQR